MSCSSFERMMNHNAFRHSDDMISLITMLLVLLCAIVPTHVEKYWEFGFICTLVVFTSHLKIVIIRRRNLIK